MKNLLIIAAVLAVASEARAVQPDRTLESAASATGQNIRVASNADASGEYGVVVGSNRDADDATTLFAVCEKCDDTTATYVFSVTAAGNWTLDSSAPLITTASTATGLNLGIASGANASGEYGVVVGTTAAAAAGLDLFATAVDVDGTPVYSLVVETIAAGGTGANIYNTASATGTNMTLSSGANASGEYGVVVGTSAAASALVELFGIASDVDGTPVYALSVENIAADGSGASVYNTASAAGINLTLASGANASGDYGVTVGSNAIVSDGTQLFSVASDIDGTPAHVFTVTAAGNLTLDTTVPLLSTTSSAAGLNLGIGSGADASGDYGVVVGTHAAASALVELFGIASDIDGTPVYALSVENIAADGSGANISNTASAAGINLTIASGADVAGDYGVTVGSNANAADATPLFSVAEDIDGTPTHVLTVDAIGNVGGLLAGRGSIVICGTLDTIASNTVYYGPNTAIATTGYGMTCDTTATGNTTEATADAPAFTAKAFQVLGMVCRNADTNVTEVTYTLRSAEANLTPSVTCSVADGVLDCVADVQTTTAVASGATIAVAASEADEAVGAVTFACVIDIAY